MCVCVERGANGSHASVVIMFDETGGIFTGLGDVAQRFFGSRFRPFWPLRSLWPLWPLWPTHTRRARLMTFFLRLCGGVR